MARFRMDGVGDGGRLVGGRFAQQLGRKQRRRQGGGGRFGVDLGLGSIVRRGMEAKSRGSGFGLAFGLGDECGFGADNIDSLGVLCG